MKPRDEHVQRRQHGGSYLLRQRSPLSRLGRQVSTMRTEKMAMILMKMRARISIHQLSLSSDYVADPALLEPQYNFPRWNHQSFKLFCPWTTFRLKLKANIYLANLPPCLLGLSV